jgi:hypothetical protein
MSLLAVLHTPSLHLAMLRGSAWLVPVGQRAEWLAEWQSELWYAWREVGDQSDRRPELTGFCLGACKDALSIRRTAPLPRTWGSLQIEAAQVFPDLPSFGESRLLDSPIRCLVLLAILAAISGAGALLRRGGPHLTATLVPAVTLMFIPGWLVARVTTAMSLRDSPGALYGAKLLTFFAAKMILMLAISIFTVAFIVGGGERFIAWAGQFPYWAAFLAIRWALKDQRDRCPVCLRRLGNTVSIGDRSKVFLEWHGTESMCLKGHGLLRVPENPEIGYHGQRWLQFDPFCAGLFRQL